MKHLFTKRYLADDGGQSVSRTRCVRCGMGSTWAGARDGCAGGSFVARERVETPEKKLTRRDRAMAARARARADLLGRAS